MNLKTGIAALAIATAPMAAKAQTAVKTAVKNDSVVNVVKSHAQKADTLGATITFSQAQKMLGIGKKAPKGMVTVTNQKGKFVGKVSPQGLNGDLVYESTSKMIADPTMAPKVKMTYGVNYMKAQHLPGHAGEVYANVEKGKFNGKLSAIVGKTKDDVNGGVKLKAGYDYPLSQDFSVGPRVGIHTGLYKVNNDAKGAFAPEIGAGGKFKHEFESGVRVGAEANAGLAARSGYNNRQTHVGKIAVTADGNASVGYKDVDLVVGGGKDVHFGDFVTAGLKCNF